VSTKNRLSKAGNRYLCITLIYVRSECCTPRSQFTALP